MEVGEAIWFRSRSPAQGAPILPTSHKLFLCLPSLVSPPHCLTSLSSWEPRRACLTQFCPLALESITANKSVRYERRKGCLVILRIDQGVFSELLPNRSGLEQHKCVFQCWGHEVRPWFRPITLLFFASYIF